MAGQTDQPQDGATPVPDLIERYRSRRDAWIAQADELARLRDEVRGSAEREAMEIVTAARRDVRKVVMEARRELLVLSAQVQAALGEATPKTDPATLLNKAGITPEPGARTQLTGMTTAAFAAEEAVNGILNEVHEDMTALAEDAKALPLKAVPGLRQISAPSSPSQAAAAPQFSRTPSVATPHRAPVQPSATAPATSKLTETAAPASSGSESSALSSSPFPSDAVPVLAGRRLSAFVGLFFGLGILVAGVTTWWFSRGGQESSQPSNFATTATPNRPSDPATTGQPQPTNTDKASTPPPAPADSANLSLVAEAVRDVWVRTTIDGRPDDGRTLAAGQVIDVSAEQSISLRVGDAGAIVVSVNHGQKRPLGRDGQVMTRQFVVEGAKVRERAPTPPEVDLAPEPPGSRGAAPPIAAAPAVATPFPAPTSSSGSAGVAVTNQPPPSTPAVAQAAPVSQLAANGPQPSASIGAVNQPNAPTPSAAPPAPAGSPANIVVAIARQWLDAYHRQDRAAMAILSADNLLLADERRADERFPPGLSDVTRTLDRVSVQIAADTAVLTAVMLEQSESVPSPHVSPISQVWVLGGGQWKVRQARFVSEARLNQVFR